MNTVKIILAILLFAMMIFMMFGRDDTQAETELEFKECLDELYDITDEICGLEHDAYIQQSIAEDIKEEIEK